MREKDAATTIIFLRHGMTDFPHDRIYCDSREDPPLNSQGLAQAQWAANLLAASPIQAIYHSPTARTTITASMAAKHHDVPMVALPALMERRFGIWEGLYFHEIEQRYPNDYLAWKKDQAGYKPADGGESFYELEERLQQCLQSFIQQHTGATLLVVSHVGPIRVCISSALRMPLSMARQLNIDFAAISRIDYGSRNINLRYLNMIHDFKA